MRFFRFTAPLLLFSHFSQAIETRQPMTADVYSLRPGIRSQHHQPLQPPHRTDGKKMGRDLTGPSLRSKLRHCSRISEDSFHCMQVDTGSRSGETAGWFHPGYSDCFMTARLLKSLLKKRCAEPDSGNSRIIPIIQICNWSGTAHIAS